MRTISLSSWCARFVLLTCLSFAVSTAFGSSSPNPAATPEAGAAEQSGTKTAGQLNAPSAKHVDDDGYPRRLSDQAAGVNVSRMSSSPGRCLSVLMARYPSPWWVSWR